MARLSLVGGFGRGLAIRVLSLVAAFAVLKLSILRASSDRNPGLQNEAMAGP